VRQTATLQSMKNLGYAGLQKGTQTAPVVSPDEATRCDEEVGSVTDGSGVSSM
jgi:hypothetical protein